MKIVLLMSCALASAFPAAAEVEVRSGFGPTTVSWDELRQRYFDLRWRLPDERRAPGRDLLQEMEALLKLRFEIEGDDATVYRCFGDLVRAAAPLDGGTRGAWLDRLATRAPQVFDVWGWPLRELLLDDALFAGDWDPDEEHPRDGFFEIDAWNLRDESAQPWADVRVEAQAEQGALLIRSDLATLKEVENDYRHYFGNVGAAYKKLRPVPESFVSGEDARGRPFSSLRLDIRSDLPFPYTSYKLFLDILNRVDDSGRLVTDIYSTSDDFYWLAGRDVFMPVTGSDGSFQGHLVVRVYGFDLRGVPDASKHRRAALRSSLGNLRRKVEPLFRTRGSPEPDPDGSPLPSFRVHGG